MAQNTADSWGFLKWVRSPYVWAIVALALLTTSRAAADDDAEKWTEIRVRVAQLASSDQAVRSKAAERIFELGPDAIEAAARASAGLDTDAWTTFATACTSAKHRCWPVPFIAAAETAPAAHRARLLALATRIEPGAGSVRTPEEIGAIVREFLIERRNERCTHGHDTAIAILGHQAVPAIFALMRGTEGKTVSIWTAYSALDWIAEPGDIPVLRELLLSGGKGAADALGRLQRRGSSEASDALLAAVAAGEFHKRIGKALVSTPVRARAVKAVRAWIAQRAEPTEEDRSLAAELFGKLGPAAASETVGDLEMWLAASTKAWAISTIATALTRLGSRKGVETLVRLVGETPHGRCGCKCCKDLPAPEVPPGSLCAEGFGIWERWPATKLLGKIAGREVFLVPTDEERDAARKAARDAGREPETTDELVARAAAAYHAWWRASKDRLTFDATAGRWSTRK